MGNNCNIVARSRRDAQSLRPLDIRPGMRVVTRPEPSVSTHGTGATSPKLPARWRTGTRRGSPGNATQRIRRTRAPAAGVIERSDPALRRAPVGSRAEQGRYAPAPSAATTFPARGLVQRGGRGGRTAPPPRLAAQPLDLGELVSGPTRAHPMPVGRRATLRA